MYSLPTDFLPGLSFLGRYETSAHSTKELTSKGNNLPSDFAVHLQKIKSDNFDLFEAREVVLVVTYTAGISEEATVPVDPDSVDDDYDWEGEAEKDDENPIETFTKGKFIIVFIINRKILKFLSSLLFRI